MIENIEDKNEIDVKSIPEPSDGTRLYSESNYGAGNFYPIEDDFEGTLDWVASGTGTVSIQGFFLDHYLRMYGDGNNHNNAWLYATYNLALPRMYTGYLQFNYQIQDVGSDLHLYCQVEEPGSIWTTVWTHDGIQTSETSSGVVDLSSYDLDHANVNVRFAFRYDSNNGEYTSVYIDDFYLFTYEFIWGETKGDTINPNEDQTLNLFVCPNYPPTYFSALDVNNVTLFYRIGNSDLSNPDGSIVASQTSNNYTFTFDSAEYHAGQTIYYRIWINQDGVGNRHRTAVRNFVCVTDTQNPSVTNLDGNYTLDIYYDRNDVLVNCTITDNWELNDVRLYVKNGSAPTSVSDPLARSIECNFTKKSKPIPENGGNFEFNITRKYLSARAPLYFLIWAQDHSTSARTNFTEGGSFQPLDDIKPNMKNNGNNSNNNQIDCEKALEVSYNITEPKAGSGVQSAIMYVMITDSNHDPTTDPWNYDHSYTPDGGLSSPDGGQMNFTMDIDHYESGKTIFYWINTSDVSGNKNSTLSKYGNITIVDGSAPAVSHNGANGNPCNYNTDKNLIFTLSEPKAGSGIDNNTLKLYFQVNSSGLTSPKVVNADILKYGDTITFTIGESNFTYYDTVYYRLEVDDLDSNHYASSILSFQTTDSVGPTIQEAAANTNGWVYDTTKNLNFYLSDPNFDPSKDSSGLQKVELYYKARGAPTTSVYDGKIIQTTAREQNWYGFNPYFNATDFENGPSIWYFTRTFDIQGNYIQSTAKNFTLYQTAYKPETLILPASVIGSKEFTISCNMNFYTNIWYSINGTFYKNDAPNNITFYKKLTLEEGHHKIGLHFMNGLRNITFTVEIDLTPPSKISLDTITTKVIGNVVELYWTPPADSDLQTTYKIYRSTSATFDIGEDTYIGLALTSNEPRFQDDALKTEEVYYYKIVSVDRVGNIGEASEVIVVQMQGSILIYVFIGIIIGAVAISGYVVVKKVKSAKTNRSLSQVNLKDLEVKYDIKEKPVQKGPEWKSLDPKIERKRPTPKEPQKESSDIQFDDRKPLSLEGYWQHSVGSLLSQVAQFQLSNDKAKAMNVYSMLIRMSKKIGNSRLTDRLITQKEQFIQSLAE